MVAPVQRTHLTECRRLRQRRQTRPMPGQARVALDAMGGDHGASVVFGGRLAHPPSGHRIPAYGDRAVVEPLLDGAAAAQSAGSRIRAHRGFVAVDDSRPRRCGPAGRIVLDVDGDRCGEKGRSRRRRISRQYRRLDGDVEIRSARFAGIDRPAIACFVRRARGESVMLDSAPLSADAHIWSISPSWATRCARTVRHRAADRGPPQCRIGRSQRPRGESRSRALLRATSLPHRVSRLRQGDDIARGRRRNGDRGISGQVRRRPRRAPRANSRNFSKRHGSDLGGAASAIFCPAPRSRTLRDKMDPRVNGGVFFGLNRIVVKSHGGTDSVGFAKAIDVGLTWSTTNFSTKLAKTFARYAGKGDDARASGISDGHPFVRYWMRQLSAAQNCQQRRIGESVKTTDEWIVQRTGIRERHIARRARSHPISHCVPPQRA